MAAILKALLARVTKNPKTTALAITGLIGIISGRALDNDTVEVIGGVLGVVGAAAGKD